MEGFSGDSRSPDSGRVRDLERLREQLDFFVFFHLGADAEISLRACQGTLRIAIAHQRIRPLTLELTWERVGELAQSPEAFETYMLDRLTSHRRHQA